MNKTILAMAIVAAAILTACGNTEAQKEVKSEVPVVYTRYGMGGNAVYEFVPKTAPWMRCVFVEGSQESGLSCFPDPLYKGNK